MSSKYLDYGGLSYLWTKLKAYFQVKLVSGTNIKTINNQSILGSGNITVSGSSTSVPTANASAAFDSTAHMNSTDMTTTEVSDFVDGLDVSGGGAFANVLIDLPQYQTADTTDKAIYDAVVALGWGSDVLIN